MGSFRHREDTTFNTSTAYATTCLTSANGTCTSDPTEPSTPGTLGVFSGNARTRYRFRAMDDTVTPNYHKLAAQGKIINNPMSFEVIDETIPNFGVNLRFYGKQKGCWDPVMRFYNYNCTSITGTDSMSRALGAQLFLGSPGIDFDVAKELVVTKAHARIGAEQMLGLSAVAELNESVVGLTYICKKVYKVIKAVRTANLRHLKNELSFRELQEIYMNARYNLRPLCYDASAIRNIVQKTYETAKRRTYRAKKVLSASDSDTPSVVYCTVAPNYVIVRLNLHRSVTHTAEVYGGVLTDVRPVGYPQLFGLDKIIESAWDLTPGSFILDWFLNVGDTIGSFTPNFGFRTLSSWLTVKQTVSQLTTIVNASMEINPSSNWDFEEISCIASPVSAVRTTVNYTRIPDPTRSMLPNWDINLDPLKLLDLGIIMKKIRFCRIF